MKSSLLHSLILICIVFVLYLILYWQRSYWQAPRLGTINAMQANNTCHILLVATSSIHQRVFQHVYSKHLNYSVVSTLSHQFSLIITGYFFVWSCSHFLDFWVMTGFEARAMASIKIRKVASVKLIDQWEKRRVESGSIR